MHKRQMNNRYFSTLYYDAFLNNNFDTPIFNELVGNYKGMFEPHEFFSLLKIQFDFVRANNEKPLVISDHLLKLSIEKSQLWYLLSKLELLIKLYIEYGVITLMEKDQMRNSQYLISEEVQKLNQEINATLYIEDSDKYNFEEVKKHLHEMSDPYDKIKYLIEIKTDYQQGIDFMELEREISFDKLCELEIEKLQDLLSLDDTVTIPKVNSISTPTKNADAKTVINPIFKPIIIDQLYDILKDYFSPVHQTELKSILQTGIVSNNKLLFKDHGNRLTDTFKKMYDHDFIVGCQKQDLIHWIMSNFEYLLRNKVKEFIEDTVEKTISRNDQPCKSPLININEGQIIKVEEPRNKKYNRY